MTTYEKAGVDIQKTDRAVSRIVRMMKRTHDPAVIHLPRGFAGLYSLGGRRVFDRTYRDPVLVSCVDGAGTKIRVAAMAKKYDTIGIDTVAMNVNDLIVTGATPLFFLDYLAGGRIQEKILTQIVSGIVEGCRQSSCSLLGGETAEMPGVYSNGDYEVAGFAVGIVERRKILDGSAVRPGDDVIGLASSGLHSNGFSLVRKVVFEKRRLRVTSRVKELGGTLGDVLLTPTRIYVRSIRAVLRRYRVKRALRAAAHITGGGIVGNLPRVLPRGCGAEIREGSWDVPAVFPWLQQLGDIPRNEMYRVFNMGLGLVLVTAPRHTQAILRTLRRSGEKASVVGRIVPGAKEVRILPPSSSEEK